MKNVIIKSIFALKIMGYGFEVHSSELIDTQTLLFCENARKSIVYVSLSSRKEGVNKVTSLFYFTDGYANQPVSNWYLTTSARIGSDRAEIKMVRVEGLVNKKVLLAPTPITCAVSFAKDLRKKMERGAVRTVAFSVECQFKEDELGLCKTNALLEQRFKIVSPLDLKTPLLIERKFTLFE